MLAAASHNALKLISLALVALLIASSWLVFPYFIQGQQLLRGVGDNARSIKAGSVSQYLTRELVHHPELELAATYASEEFFQFVDQASFVGQLRPDRNLVFFVSETIHTGDLPSAVPTVRLQVGDRQFQPAIADGPRNAQHHRVTVYSFPKRDEDGNVIDINAAGEMRLLVANDYFGSNRRLHFEAGWKSPYQLPEALKTRNSITPIAVMALGAGLLSSVLTPCLLQLVIMFGGAIAGFSTLPGQEAGNPARLNPVVRAKVMQVAIAFVAGFVLLYAAAGALIGAIGHQAQLMFAEYSRAIAVASGLVVIALGLWVAQRGSRGFACRLDKPSSLRALGLRDALGTGLASAGYALGCTACFGGAIVATLIVYVGAIGSATIGAAVMLVFGIGVAIPFLLAAWYLTKITSIMDFVARRARLLSRASAVIIVAFGLILVTDNFHALSDAIYPYLGLS